MWYPVNGDVCSKIKCFRAIEVLKPTTVVDQVYNIAVATVDRVSTKCPDNALLALLTDSGTALLPPRLSRLFHERYGNEPCPISTSTAGVIGVDATVRARGRPDLVGQAAEPPLSQAEAEARRLKPRRHFHGCRRESRRRYWNMVCGRNLW